MSSGPASPASRRGTNRAPRMNAITPIGTLTKKIHDQWRFCRMTPPITGPKIGASIIGIETTAITRPIRCGPAIWAMMIITTGMSMPPPTPWRMRKRMSSGSVDESPHAAEPSVKSTSETR